ncbi:MAG TPA: DNA mismatch repair endonuclease MutL [Chloroflexota bacterium]
MVERPRIAVLPSEVAEKVAAGEVIQRAGDVVKELVENAIDAVLARRAGVPSGAERIGTIQVELRGGGLELVRVADDGGGIGPDELELALARHGTSKLRHLDDLERVATLGFRGEALPSIGAVAELTLVTRPPELAAGNLVRVEAGRLLERGARGCPIGTQVTVRQLFFNTPARLAFQRSAGGEAAHVAHLVGAYALAYPELRFELTVDGRRVLQAGAAEPLAVLSSVYGPAAGAAALAVHLIDPAGVAVDGLISAPDLTRGRRGDILLCVNRRPVQSRPLTHAVVDAYRGFLPEARFPLVALRIELDPAEVDVNVHPAKAEVRFRRERLVYACVQRAVRAALLAEAPPPSVSAPLRPTWATPGMPAGAPRRAERSSARPHAESAPAESGWATPADARLPGLDPPARRRGASAWTDRSSDADGWPSASERPEAAAGAAARARPAPQGTAGTGVEAGGGRLPILRIVGQVQGTYIVCEGPDGVYFVDQHAAHERIRYEEVLAQRAAGGVARQRLLEPSVIELSGRLGAALPQHGQTLAGLGLEVEPFGDRSALVRSLPAGLPGSDPGRLLAELLEALEDPTPTIDGLDRAAATVACHSAVRAGDALSPELMRELIERLEGTDVGRFCPHGRPTVVRLPVSQLERDFGRR